VIANKPMLAVYASHLEPRLRFLAVVLASYGNDNGRRIFPGIGPLKRATGLEESAVRRQLRDLIDLKVLQRDGFHKGTYGDVRQYRLDLDVLAELPDTLSGRVIAALHREHHRRGKAESDGKAEPETVHTPCTDVQGVHADTPCTTAPHEEHACAETPCTPVLSPLYAGAAIDQYSLVRKNCTNQAETTDEKPDAIASVISSEEKNSPISIPPSVSLSPLADRAVTLSLQEIGMVDEKSAIAYLDDIIAKCGLTPLHRFDVKQLARAAIERHKKPHLSRRRFA